MKSKVMNEIRIDAMECAEYLAALVEDNDKDFCLGYNSLTEKMLNYAPRLDDLSFMAMMAWSFIENGRYIPQAVRRYLNKPYSKKSAMFREEFSAFMMGILEDWSQQQAAEAIGCSEND